MSQTFALVHNSYLYGFYKEQASKQASNQASKQASNQSSKQASKKQAATRERQAARKEAVIKVS